jgi:hypothetical protein
VTGARAGQVSAFRCKFFEYGNILLIKFAWHCGFPGTYFPGRGINVREGHRSLSRSGVVSPLIRHSPFSLVPGE